MDGLHACRLDTADCLHGGVGAGHGAVATNPGHGWVTGRKEVCTPPRPLYGNHPCIVNGRGEGTITFRFANLLRKLNVELLLRVLLAGQGGIICALLCTLDFLHPRHSTV